MSGSADPIHILEDARPYRWVILVISFIVLTTSFIVRVAWSNVAVSVAQEMGFRPTIIGTFVTAFFTGYVITNAFSGFIADRIGAKRLICFALLPLAVLVGSFGTVKSVPAGLAVQLGMGLCAGVNFSATTKLAASWFPSSERGLVFGILTAAVSTSVILANLLFPPLIQRFSWPAVYFVLCAVVLVVAALASMLIRDHAAETRAVNNAAPERAAETLSRLLSDRNYVFLGLAWFGGLWATWGVTFWGNTLMVRVHGLSNVEAGGVTALFATGGLFAKPIYGFLSDLIPVPRKFMLAPCLLGFAATLFAFGAGETAAEFRAWAPILGVFGFAYTAITNAMLTEVIGPRAIGAASGLMNAFIQSSTIVGPVVVGFVFDRTGSFAYAFATLAVGPLFGAGFALLIREPTRPARSSKRG